MQGKNAPLNVLVVEDLEDDLFFFEHAFQRAKLAANLFIARDGTEAIDFLQGERIPGDGRHLPDVMFLDLKMPVCDGFDVLRWMKAHHLIQRVPVFVLSGSSQEQDITLVRELGARDYLVKPITPSRLQELLKPETLLLKPAPLER